MATVVLGGIGAAIGSAVPGVGTQWGWAIGSMLGGMIDQRNALRQMSAGQLSDRTISGSSYGAGIPIVWGRWRVGGNVIWAAKDGDGNHLIQKSGGGGKGMSAPEAPGYEATVAVLFSRGALVYADGTIVDRNVQLHRLWGDDILCWDADASSNRYAIGSSLYWHSGTFTQAPNSIIVAHEGLASAQVPAYRGSAYALMWQVSLDDWGGRVPSWSAIVETDAVTFGDIATDICRMQGLTVGEISVAAASQPVRGAMLAEDANPLDLLTSLADHFACDLVEVDGAASIVQRGGSTVLTVPELELGTSSAASETPLIRRRPALKDLPSRVEVRYLDLDADLQTSTQSDMRPEGARNNVVSLDVPLVLTASEAAQRAAREMDRTWEEADEFETSLPLARLALMPSDPILLPSSRGLERARITKTQLDPLGELKVWAVAEEPGSYTQSSTGATGGQEVSPPAPPVPTAFLAWSGREIQDSHQGRPGFYVAGSGASGWQGGTIYWSPDGGSTWLTGGSVTLRSSFGQAVTALSSSGAIADTFDTTNTVQVNVSASGELLASASDTEILGGKNHAVLGGEILGFGIASPVGSGVYTLSRLRRGERGTPMTGHSIGERFVLLGSGVVRVEVPAAQIGQTIQVKVVSPGQVLGDVTHQSVAIAAPTPNTLGSLGVTGGVPWGDLTGVPATFNPLVREHVQVSLSSTWTITHNLGKVVMVQVFNPSGQAIIGDVAVVSPSQFTVTFASAQTGIVRYC
jgi:hypothetical protein